MLLQYFLALTLLTNPADTCINGKDPGRGAKYCLVNALLHAEKQDWEKSSRYLLLLDGYQNKDAKLILPFLKTGNNDFRSNIVELLGNTGDRSAVKPLIDLLAKERNPDVKISVIESLGKLRDKRAVKILEVQLSDELWGVRISAASSLEKITGKTYDYSYPPPRR